MLLGFLLFIVGILSFILEMIGVQLVFLQWMEIFGKAGSLIAKIMLTIIGIIIVFILNNNFEGEDKQNSFDEY